MVVGLRQALACLRRNDEAGARDALIAAWRARRSPALAELVELLKVPDPLPAQLAAVVAPRVAASVAALEPLARIDDPRLARWAIDALAKPPFTGATAQPFIAALIATAARLRDPRLVARAPEIRVALRTQIKRAPVRDALLAALDRAVRSLAYEEPGAAEAKLLGELATRLDALRGPHRSAEVLLAEVYAHPEDDAPRLVYADCLLGLGDPRGEFIQLQLQRGRIGEPSPREAELVKLHGKAWLGALAPALSFGKGYSKTRFERGFVAHADVMLSVGKKLAPILSHREWATIESLDGESFGIELLEAAPLRALRKFEPSLGSDAIARLARRAEPLAQVTEVLLAPMPAVPVDLDALHRAFPALVRAHLYHEPTDATLAKLAGFGIRDLTLDSYLSDNTPQSARRFKQAVAALRKGAAVFDRLQLFGPGPAGPGREPSVLVRDKQGHYKRGIYRAWYQ